MCGMLQGVFEMLSVEFLWGVSCLERIGQSSYVQNIGLRM